MASLLLIFGLVGANSAADLVVNNNTTHKNIDDWMKDNTTVKGDNLVFNVSNYELTDTINVSKSINVKSNSKTQIIFNKNKNMFNITVNNADKINFSGLTLQHNGKGNSVDIWAVISANHSYKTVNFNDINFILSNDYLCAVVIKNWNGNITNCNVIGKGINTFGFVADSWVGNIYKSSFEFEKKQSACVVAFNSWPGNVYNSKFNLKGSQSFGVCVYKNWIGNFVNNSINSLGIANSGIVVVKWLGNVSNSKININNNNSMGILSDNWVGNMYNTNISTKGLLTYGLWAGKWTGTVSKSNIYVDGYRTVGIYSNSSTKATIINSVVSAKKGVAIMISKNVKVYSTKAISMKGKDSIYIFGPILEIMGAYKYGKTSRNYYVKIKNYGENSSKTSYLTIKIGKYKKTVKFNGIKPNNQGIAKITLPKKYSTKKYLKYAKLTYYKGNGKKTTSKTFKFKF